MEIRRTLPKSTRGLPQDLSIPAKPDIHVNPLTELCLSIAALMPGQLDAVADIVNDYRKLFKTVAGTREQQSYSGRDTDLPLVSIGPSGLGGRFQREIRP